MITVTKEVCTVYKSSAVHFTIDIAQTVEGAAVPLSVGQLGPI